MNLNDHVFTHGAKRVLWTIVPGLLHETSPLREVERSKVENLKKRTISLAGCLLQILVHSNPLHNWAFKFESLNFWPCLQCFNGAFMDPMWNSYNKLSIKLLSYLHEVGLGLGIFENSSFHFCFRAFFGLSWLVIFLVYFPLDRDFTIASN